MLRQNSNYIYIYILGILLLTEKDEFYHLGEFWLSLTANQFGQRLKNMGILVILTLNMENWIICHLTEINYKILNIPMNPGSKW